MKTVALGLAAVLVILLVLAAPAGAAEPPFVDVAKQSGLDFRYRNGMQGEMLLLEITGGGAALFDYDGDGDLDLYLTQGHSLGTETDGPAADRLLTDRLYRNERLGAGGKAGPLRFTDVTEEAGLAAAGYGMGVATGDVDNDGDVDLYVTHYGANQLWRNDGDGTFTDVTASAGDGVGDTGWSVAAAFVDLDGDGGLDLYVGNYVDLSLARPKTCRAATGEVDYCGPLAYDPSPDRLLRNVSRGSSIAFQDVTRSAGLGQALPGLGVASGDFDGDGRQDLFVANDGMANQLWLNRTEAGKIELVDDALFAGIAFNADGHPEASMGVAVGDVDADGMDDLLVTHLLRETNTLYLSRGGGAFLDATGQSGLGAASWMMTGFGTAFLDYDLDGDLDLLVANGAVANFDRESIAEDDVEDWIFEEGAERPGWRLHQPNHLFRNESRRVDGRLVVDFQDVSPEAGEVFRHAEVSRGVAVGDVDEDGDPDAVVVNIEGPLRLLENRAGDGKPWLGIRALGVAVPGGSPRDMLGARVGLALGDGTHRWRTVRTDGSYASASDPRVVFALEGTGAGDAATVRVQWPDGSVEDFAGVAAGRYSELMMGSGAKVEKDGGKPKASP